MIKKGMRIMKELQFYKNFKAEVRILHHHTTITQKYQPTIHCGPVSQSAKICSMDKEILRSGDKSIVHFRFMYRPELIEKNKFLIFREGKTKGAGKILEVY